MSHFYKPADIARMLEVRDAKVYEWINKGTLPAINVSTGTIPSFRITDEGLETLKQNLAFREPEKKPARRKKEAISSTRAQIRKELLARVQSRASSAR